MALSHCSDCGSNCSTKALACPGCGRLVRARGWWAITIGWGVIMSAVISFVLSVVIVFALIALGVTGAALGSFAASQTEATQAQP